jgi:imidazole glycerol-phosphate synthase subunit HisF
MTSVIHQLIEPQEHESADTLSPGFTHRVIARLDIKGRDLVKGIHLEGLRVIGVPERLAEWYAEQGADEILYLDLVASLFKRSNLVEVVSATARHLDIPLTVGGGIRTLEDCSVLLRAGADKLAINTAAIEDPDFLPLAVKRFGASTIVASIEAKRTAGGWEALTKAGRERTGLDVGTWAARCVDFGVGEILLTSIDQDGTGRGFDCDLVASIASDAPIPVIASGGAGSVDHIVDVIRRGNADAVAVGSLFHYHPDALVVGNGSGQGEGNTTFLASQRKFASFRPLRLDALKVSLSEADVDVRPTIERAMEVRR